MASVITVAFENWKAQESASGKAVLLDEFVLANVPNLDPTQPIDRNEKLPPANQIVHRQAVNKAGLASENAVAYSVTLGAEVGNFDFNWIGLLNKASGTVAMITHAPTQKKLKTQNGQQGNVLTRSFILEFQGAAEETQIKTSAETWQIDFTARLSGIDEMQRLINVDSYGTAAFFNDGFEVTRSGEQYTVKKGLGYVGGLRGELAQNQILNGLRNTKIYADFSYQGNIVSQWNTVVKITSAATLNNYVDAAGFTHQVFAIASIDASGNVKDLRSMGALSSQEISALETRFKFDLSKKIDKANITHQMGNSTELVVSQQLLATELGKKQPAGNYAPAGDYATNTALNNGLNNKLNSSLSYSITNNDVIWNGAHSFREQVGIGELGMKGKRMWISLSGVSINPTGEAFYSVYWPTKSGTLITSADITPTTGTSSSLIMNQNGVTNELAKKLDKTSVAQTIGNSTTSVLSQNATTNLLFGVNQNYSDLTSQRSAETVYTNTTGKPIAVFITSEPTMATSNTVSAYVDDVRVFSQTIGGGNNLTKNITASFIVPAGSKYKASSSVAIEKWVELR